MRRIVLSFFFSVLSVAAFAASPPALSAADTNEDAADQYFAKKALALTPQEKKALAIGQHWQTGPSTSKAMASAHGEIQFIYGDGQTQLVCSVLQVCDVALQPGEQVNNVNVGDPRFTVEPAITGVGAAQTLHLLIKPLDVGLDTSLVVTTDRRAYHFRLRSTRSQFMPFVSFMYPEDVEQKWNQMVKNRQENTIPQTNEYLGDLNFHYTIMGSARWKPTRVYNDGRKTIIEMPTAMQQTEAPTLLVVRNNGLLKKSDTQMVNYRVQGNRYIVDSVFDRAILIAGVGSSQTRITITRGA